MEYCAGGDLTHYIKKRGRVEASSISLNLVQAPQYYPSSADWWTGRDRCSQLPQAAMVRANSAV